MRNFWIVAIVLAGLAGASPIWAQEAAEDADTEGFTIKPQVIDAENGDGTILGLEYKYQRTFRLDDYATSDSGPTPIPSPDDGGITLAVDSKGFLTADADRNPRNLIDARVTLNAEWNPGFQSPVGRMLIGAFIKGEADQTLGQHQTVFGARGFYGDRGIFDDDDFLFIDLGYGRVEPGEDEARAMALGATDLDAFDRIDLEAGYLWRTGRNPVRTIEVNYRLYQEVDALPAVAAAGLDRSELMTIRLGLPGDFFIGYSTGKLPFDRTDDQALEIGLSYKLF